MSQDCCMKKLSAVTESTLYLNITVLGMSLPVTLVAEKWALSMLAGPGFWDIRMVSVPMDARIRTMAAMIYRVLGKVLVFAISSLGLFALAWIKSRQC